MFGSRIRLKINIESVTCEASGSQAVVFWLGSLLRSGSQPESKRWSWLCYLLEIAVWSGLIFGAIVCFDLQLDWAKKSVTSRTGTVLRGAFSARYIDTHTFKTFYVLIKLHSSVEGYRLSGYVFWI